MQKSNEDNIKATTTNQDSETPTTGVRFKPLTPEQKKKLEEANAIFLPQIIKAIGDENRELADED